MLKEVKSSDFKSRLAIMRTWYC